MTPEQIIKDALKAKRDRNITILIQGNRAYVNRCQCITPGEDDGLTTCWVHHNCSDGSCTHQDGEDD